MYVTSIRHQPEKFLVQVTDSWRTGSRASDSSGASPSTNNFEQFPIRRKGESLLSYQGRKNNYYARAGKAFSEASNFTGRSTVDEGHSFRTVKFGTVPGVCTSFVPTTGAVLSRLPYSTAVYLPEIDANWAVNLPAFKQLKNGLELFFIGGSPSANPLYTDVSQSVTGAYTSMLPEKQLFGWGETVVELLRGNFPKAIPDLIRRANFGKTLSTNPKAYKDAVRSVGSDYLNARFGIEPIVRDTVKTVEHLMQLSDMLFDNTKRSRMTQMHHMRLTTSQALAWNGTQSVTVGTPPVSNMYLSSDARIVARFRKARPNVQANSFYEQALDWLDMVGSNPKLAWDLLPWSWLVDWSGNIGNTITNASFAARGNYHTDYAWVTRKTTSSTLMSPFRTYDRRGRLSYEATKTYKWAAATQRTIISPFGPQFTMPSLSAYQWSILVSLGLARVR